MLRRVTRKTLTANSVCMGYSGISLRSSVRWNTTAADKEKKAEEEREAALRAKFDSSSSISSTSSSSAGSEARREGESFFDFMKRRMEEEQNKQKDNQINMGEMKVGSAASPYTIRFVDQKENKWWRAFILVIIIYSFWLWYNLKYDVSKHTSGFGLPGWAVSPETYAGWSAMRYLISTREQSSLLQEYKGFRDTVPNASLAHFLLQRHPQFITGHYTPAPEFLAALSAVHAWEKDRHWVSKVFGEAGYGDLPSKVDKVMEAIRRDYAGALSKGVPVPAVLQPSASVSNAQMAISQLFQGGGGGEQQPQMFMMNPAMLGGGGGAPQFVGGQQFPPQQNNGFQQMAPYPQMGMTFPPPQGLHSTPGASENSSLGDISNFTDRQQPPPPTATDGVVPGSAPTSSTGGGTVPFQ